jgi:uncharacterized protein
MPFLHWTGVEEWLAESAMVDLADGGLSVAGTQLGAEPAPYRVDYRLDAPDFVTRELELTAIAEGWRRHLLIRHDGSGAWEAEVDDEGEVPGDARDGSLPDLSEARDIDIEFSPLTNTMPILRHGFQREGSGEFLMAFVTMPSLRVEASPQRYEHVRRTETGSVVRFISKDSDFTADLELDSNGLLAFYPRLAKRVKPGLRVG